jgi:hypothetical protein
MLVGLASWLVPGAGYLLLEHTRRAIIVFLAIFFTFCIGLYVGSVGVVDPIGAKLWYVFQIMTSPLVAILGHISAGGGYPVFGRPCEIGQIYTSVAGMLNLLCMVNATYTAHISKADSSGG